MNASAVQPTARQGAASKSDVTGRDRLVKNILASWGGQLVFIVAGFVMPRLIDRTLGQVSLGIWDFAWSVVSYFTLAQVGVGSSVNRYVAKFRATGDVDALNRIVSSVHAIQLATSLFALVLSAVLAWMLPSLMSKRLIDPATARWVIALLGSAIAVQMAFNSYAGVLTGCHRWDLHNAVTSIAYAAIAIGMIIGLLAGGGLRAMSMTYLAGTLGAEIVRRALAVRICPELHVDLRRANLQDVRMLFVFGGKTVVDNLARLLVAQANSLLVATHLGPAALAVYARPTALVRQADTLTNKFGLVLTPAVSSLKSSGRTKELRELFLNASRFATFIAMPITLFLAIMGDPILQVWMGPRYREGLLMAVVALGNFLSLMQRPAGHVLVGLNAHGRVGWASLTVACCGVGAAMVTLGPLNGGLVAAALSLVVPYSLGNGLFIMLYACRKVGVPLREYVGRVFGTPMACALPYAAALLLVRIMFDDTPTVALTAAVVVSAVILVPLYWVYVVPDQVRLNISDRLPKALARRLVIPRTPVASRERRIQLTIVGQDADRCVDLAATTAPLRPLPYPYKAGLAICSDLDLTPDRDVYLETTRFLNTTEPTTMGFGVGLEVGNTIYFDMDPSQFAYWNTDEQGREMVRTLIRSGHIDCLHSFGDLATTRGHAARALEDLARHGCRLEVWIDHAVAATNFGADIMRGNGDVPGAAAYHADLTCDAGARFVWRGRVTSIVGQNVERSLIGIWNAAHPAASSKTLVKEAVKGWLAWTGNAKYDIHGANDLVREATLRDGRPVLEFLRSNPHFAGVSRGDTAFGLAEVLDDRTLGRLVARGGLSVIYTHLGKTRSNHEPFDGRARAALRRLARLRDEGTLLVTTTRRLLGYAAALRRVAASVTPGAQYTRVDLQVRVDRMRPIAKEDLSGLTVYLPDATRVRLFVDGREVTAVRHNGPDQTGRRSVSIPWPSLQFPELCV
jgi:O-antigen/teichoic acid export membrane protein